MIIGAVSQRRSRSLSIMDDLAGDVGNLNITSKTRRGRRKQHGPQALDGTQEAMRAPSFAQWQTIAAQPGHIARPPMIYNAPQHEHKSTRVQAPWQMLARHPGNNASADVYSVPQHGHGSTHDMVQALSSAQWQTFTAQAGNDLGPLSTSTVPLNGHGSTHGMKLRSRAQMQKPQLSGVAGWRTEKQLLLPRPQPTQAYLAQADASTVRLPEPRPLLIILDLNGTILRKSSRSNFVKRMFAIEFLKYVTTRHTVMIWSSARPETVSKRCVQLFEEAGLPVPQLVWDRSHFNLSRHHYDANPQLYKELGKVWQHPNVKAASEGVVFDQTNTILIDDTEEKAAAEPYNLLKVDEFVSGKKEYGELRQVATYLEEARFQSNVSAYLKQTPFVLDPAAPEHDWTAVDGAPTEQILLSPRSPIEDDEEGGVPLRE